MTESFYEIACACGRVYGAPIPKRLLELGDNADGWHVVFNPTDNRIGNVEPFSARVKWNGWPAGIIGPSGGILAAGDLASESTLIEWLKGINAGLAGDNWLAEVEA